MKLIPRLIPVCAIVCLIRLDAFAHPTPGGPALGEEQGCTREVTLGEFRAIALERSPLVAEIDSQYAREVAQAYDTEVFKNPEVQFEQAYTRMKLDGASDPQTNASIGLPLRLSNFGAKSHVAMLLRKAGDAQRRAALLELTQKLLLRYSNLYVLQRSEALLGEAERRAAKKVSVIHQGVQKGLLSEGDHRLFEGERYRLQSQRAGLHAAIAASQADLGMLLGTPCGIKASTAPSITDLPKNELVLARAKESDLSEEARAQLGTTLRAEQLRLAELDAVPEFVPRVIYQHTNDGGDFVGAGVSFPLPIFNRNRGSIERSSAELAAEQRKRDLLSTGGLEAQVRALYLAAASSATQARIFQEKVVPAFEDALRSQEQLYSEGKGSVLQVWQTLRAYNDTQREALQVWLGAVNARAQLSLLVGEEI
jgi:cobalt-zinc-cadmium efflux system outer membrane protein